MKRRKTLRFIVLFLGAVLLLSTSKVHAQFSGSVTLSGFKTQNADVSTTQAGRDTTTPDRVFNPSLDLIYNWNISNPAAIKFEASVTPNLYLNVKSRSYIKSLISGTGNFYLSNVDEKIKPIPVPKQISPPPAASPKSDTLAKSTSKIQTDTSGSSKIVITPKIDNALIASEELSALSELMDSFDIDKKGLKDDLADIAADLKDSVSESVLALSDILSTQPFTESIAEVVASELVNQKKIFAQVPMESAHRAEINNGFDSAVSLLHVAKTQSDILPIPKPAVDISGTAPTQTSPTSANTQTAKDLIAQALVHLEAESKDDESVKTENAPLITLINSQTSLNEFSSQDIMAKEDVVPMTKKISATLLSVPVSFETQNNRDAYKLYSYLTFEFKPRLDLYFGKNVGLGLTYDLSITKFPNDNSHLSDGMENLLRAESRIEFAPGFVFLPELGFSVKSYDKTIQYTTLVPVKGHPFKPDTVKVTTPKNYNHTSFGAGLIFLPFNTLSFGFAETLTRSSELRPYLTDSVLTARSRLGGTATDDAYSYDLTRESIFMIWRVFWNLDIAADFVYENRKYNDIQVPRKVAKITAVTVSRSDSGPQFGFDISRQFLFDSRLIGIFESLTPTIDLQSINSKSTLAQYNYKDFTATLSIECGF